MKFIGLAYGRGDDWEALSESEQEAMLAHDKVLVDRGDFVAPVKPEVITVRAWDGTPTTTDEPYAKADLPLAGFSIIEADSVEQVIDLVAGTPCARAKGYIEIRPFWRQ